MTPLQAQAADVDQVSIHVAAPGNSTAENSSADTECSAWVAAYVADLIAAALQRAAAQQAAAGTGLVVPTTVTTDTGTSTMTATAITTAMPHASPGAANTTASSSAHPGLHTHGPIDGVTASGSPAIAHSLTPAAASSAPASKRTMQPLAQRLLPSFGPVPPAHRNTSAFSSCSTVGAAPSSTQHGVHKAPVGHSAGTSHIQAEGGAGRLEHSLPAQQRATSTLGAQPPVQVCSHSRGPTSGRGQGDGHSDMGSFACSHTQGSQNEAASVGTSGGGVHEGAVHDAGSDVYKQQHSVPVTSPAPGKAPASLGGATQARAPTDVVQRRLTIDQDTGTAACSHLESRLVGVKQPGPKNRSRMAGSSASQAATDQPQTQAGGGGEAVAVGKEDLAATSNATPEVDEARSARCGCARLSRCSIM